MDIKIIDKPEQPAAEMEVSAFIISFPFVMKSGYSNLVAFLKEKDIQIVSPPYCRYVNVTKSHFKYGFFKRWELRLGIPVDKEFSSDKKNIKYTVFPAGKYIQCLHKGPYRSMGKTHRKCMSWIQENNYQYKAESVEIYISDPSKTPQKDLETWVLAKI